MMVKYENQTEREREREMSHESLLVCEIGAIKAQNKKVYYTLKSFKGHFVQQRSGEEVTT